MTPAQRIKIESWAEQRDSLLREIGVLTVERDSLKTQNKEYSESFSDIQLRISAAEARLEAYEMFLDKAEGTVSGEVARLTAEKSALESDILAQKKEIDSLESKKANLVQDIADLTDIFTKVSGKTEALDKIVEHVQRISRENVSDVHALLGSLNKSIISLIDVSEKNVKSTNLVLAELPRYIFELQKPIPVRRHGDPLEIRAAVLKDKRSKK